jgi:hypothetical protein
MRRELPAAGITAQNLKEADIARGSNVSEIYFSAASRAAPEGAFRAAGASFGGTT